jgi:hypothetical protein
VCLLSFPALADSDHGHGHGYLKPGAPIQIAGDQAVQIPVGELRSIDVPFVSTQDSGLVSISVSADDGLQLGSDRQYELDLSQDMAISLDISASEAGSYYLHFHAGIDGLLRAMAYRVQVGDPQVVQQKARAAGGMKSFAAQETVLQK